MARNRVASRRRAPVALGEDESVALDLDVRPPAREDEEARPRGPEGWWCGGTLLLHGKVTPSFAVPPGVRAPRGRSNSRFVP